MNYEEVNELLAAYALDALDAEEVAAVREHLGECELHDEAESLRATALLLAKSVEEVEPSSALKTRLMSEIQDGVSRGNAAPRTIQPSLADAHRWRPLIPYAAAAVFALISLGLLVWNVAILSSDEAGARTATFAQSVAGSGDVTYIEEERLVVFRLRGLEEAPAGSTYQAWALNGGVATSLGVFSLGLDGTVAFTANLGDAEGVAISVEPEGGSDQPTSEPILVANF